MVVMFRTGKVITPIPTKCQYKWTISSHPILVVSRTAKRRAPIMTVLGTDKVYT